MIRGMRVRLTSTVNKRLKLFKHRRAYIVGWTLDSDEASAVEDGERRLTHQPMCIYIKVEGATWRVDDLDLGVYPLFPASKKWEIGRDTRVYARRKGFELVPDVSGTSHMYQARRLALVVIAISRLECASITTPYHTLKFDITMLGSLNEASCSATEAKLY